MRISKVFITILALAIAIAFSPLPELQAAVLSPGSGPQVDSSLQTVKAKRSMKKHKRHRKHRRGKRARSKGPGMCGTYMYWSKKKRKCEDKRK